MSNMATQAEEPASKNNQPPLGLNEPPAPAPQPAPMTQLQLVESTLAQEAVALLKQHPLRALAVGAAAQALVEVEFAVGVLAGLGVTALLVTRTGAEVRREVLTQARKLVGMTRSGGAEPLKAACCQEPQ